MHPRRHSPLLNHKWYLRTDGMEVRGSLWTYPITSIFSWNRNKIQKLARLGGSRTMIHELQWVRCRAGKRTFVRIWITPLLPGCCQSLPARISHGPLSNPRAFDAMSAACCHRQGDSWSRNRRFRHCPFFNKSTPPSWRHRMKGSCNCVSGMDPGGFRSCAIGPSVQSIRGQHSPLQTTSLPASFPIFFFQRSLPFHIIAKMASAESDLVRCYDDGRALHANIGLKRTQKICSNLTAASKSEKRRACP
jgi:hypothetical protein